MNSSKNLFRLTQSIIKNTSRNASGLKEVPSKNFPKLKKNQEHFGVEDGVLIHLKGGFFDKLLLLITTGAVTVGTLEGLRTFYILAVKK
ncbi:hypothetical protein ABEB36_006463 [Hypothenemus hampei]|uniref:Uncharacterized protein n=1 Tax=Hypothenemus hampei TaxID=57062 RepID=A0ABD1ER22_HYPHA